MAEILRGTQRRREVRAHVGPVVMGQSASFADSYSYQKVPFRRSVEPVLRKGQLGEVRKLVAAEKTSTVSVTTSRAFSLPYLGFLRLESKGVERTRHSVSAFSVLSYLSLGQPV